MIVPSGPGSGFLPGAQVVFGFEEPIPRWPTMRKSADRFQGCTTFSYVPGRMRKPGQPGPPCSLTIGGLGGSVGSTAGKRHTSTVMALLSGLSRTIGTIRSPRYRKVKCEPLEEVPVPNEHRAELEEKLRQAILDRRSDDEEIELPDRLPVEFLTDYLLQRLQLPQSTMLDLFGEPVVTKRAEVALREHDDRE